MSGRRLAAVATILAVVIATTACASTSDRATQRALAALAGARDQDKKPVHISLQGDGERRVRIGYVVETPGWNVVPAERFVAADLDDLIDSPFHAGPGPVLELDAAGRPLTLAVWGRPDDSIASTTPCTAIIHGARSRSVSGSPRCILRLLSSL